MRLDYQPSGAHRVTGRLVFDHYNLIEPGGTFISSQMPTVPTNRMRPGRNVQINHYWTLQEQSGQRGEVQLLGQRPEDPAGRRRVEAIDLRLPVPADLLGRRHVLGQHSQRGLQRRLRHVPRRQPVAAVAHVGLLVLGQRHVDQGRAHAEGGVPRPLQHEGPERPLGLPRDSSASTRTGRARPGNAFADALLGNFRTYSEAQLDPIGYFRYWQHEAFVSDAWRVNERLSVEVGLRYAWQMPTVTLGNNTTSFDPAHVQPVAGGERADQRHDRRRLRQPLQRSDAAGRRALRPGSKRAERRKPGGGVDSGRAAPRLLQVAEPVGAARQLRLQRDR